MALINCPNCNGTVSTKASACPHCGAAPIAPLTQKERILKMADELGSMSAAIAAMEDRHDTTERDMLDRDRPPSPLVTAQAGNPQIPQQMCETTQLSPGPDSIWVRPLPNWIGVPMTAITHIISFGLICGFIFVVIPSKWHSFTKWIHAPKPHTASPDKFTREPQHLSNHHSQELVDELFEMQNPGLRERIGIVAFEVQRQQFRKSQGFDELPKPSSSK